MRLSELTTLRLGGPVGAYRRVESEAELVEAVRGAEDDVLVLGGGSNVVAADAGFAGTVLHVATRGVAASRGAAPPRASAHVTLEVAAGEPWDPFVASCVADGLAGVECLAGIPGLVGATPIQNVGAYGQEVAETIVSVRVLDRGTGAVQELAPEACGFAYRSSAFKRAPGRWVVLAVHFALHASGESTPIRYAELARTLGVEVGARAPLAEVREAVLALRRGKGMVLDPDDPDTASAGSFFTNPILDADALPPEAPAWPEADGRVKTSAAWLIQRAGFARGHGDPGGIAISSKHVLALTNRGAGTTAQLVALAREIAAGVQETFGIALVPEPVFVGHRW